MREDLFKLYKIAQKRGHLAFAEMLKEAAFILTPEQEDIRDDGGCVAPLKQEEKKDVLFQQLSNGEITKEHAEAKLKKVMYCGDYGGKRKPSSNYCQKHHDQRESQYRRRNNKCVVSECPNYAKEGSLKCERCLAQEEAFTENEKVDKKLNRQRETEQKKQEEKDQSAEDQLKKAENTREGKKLLIPVDDELDVFREYLRRLEKEKIEDFSKEHYEEFLEKLNILLHRAEKFILGKYLIDKRVVDRLKKLKDTTKAYEARREVLLLEMPAKREVKNTPTMIF